MASVMHVGWGAEVGTQIICTTPLASLVIEMRHLGASTSSWAREYPVLFSSAFQDASVVRSTSGQAKQLLASAMKRTFSQRATTRDLWWPKATPLSNSTREAAGSCRRLNSRAVGQKRAFPPSQTTSRRFTCRIVPTGPAWGGTRYASGDRGDRTLLRTGGYIRYTVGNTKKARLAGE